MTNDLKRSVQDVLDGRSGFDLEKFRKQSKRKLDTYKIYTAYRFCKYIAAYRNQQIEIGDLLISLRNYLLLFQDSVILPDDIDIYNNKVGLKIDGSGRCYAVMNFPAYLNAKIVEQGFMRNLIEIPREESFLGVSPNVYRITGFKQYKSLAQKIAVTGSLNLQDGYTALVCLPTGGGKSLITQTMSYQNNKGLTIVVVPTVSLAMDQERISRENIKISRPEEIFCYYSALPDQSKNNIYQEIKAQRLRLLFISPEALIKNERFRAVIDEANTSGYLKNIIIDEAHIVIEWGSFFRLDYQCLEPWRNRLMFVNDKLKTVLLSATFEKETVTTLKNMFAKPDKWVEIRCDSLRREPRFTLIKAKNESDKKRKLVELLHCLPRPMVIYVTAPDQAEEIRKIASENGYKNTVTFTGRTGAEARKNIIKGWSENEFDIVIATSAFGVGVDKPDVRTVLHMYVPENANKYYQELGRGGRDGLPSLSVMCIYPKKDLDSAFYLTTKVLSTQKIVGRWNSMLNSPTSRRLIENYVNVYTLDTAVKPNYNEIDYAEDANTADIKWNMYVILLLRRSGLIRIVEMIVDPVTQNYMIKITIENGLLLKDNHEMFELIDRIREEEWHKNESDFRLMCNAVNTGSRMCWSEMFFDTYSLVSAYCGGCDNHTRVIEEERSRFKLVKKIDKPVKRIPDKVSTLLGNNYEAIMLMDQNNYSLLSKVINLGFGIIVLNDECISFYIDLLLNLDSASDINFMGISEYLRMIESKDYYYVSGAAIILYDSQMTDVYKKVSRIRRMSQGGHIKLLHVFEKNLYFRESQKDAVSMIDGPVLEEYDVERM